MKKFKYYQGLCLAFYSKEFYRDVATSWTGLGFSYLFLLVLFASIPLFIGYTLLVKHYLSDFNKVLTNVQRIEIVDGNLKFTGAAPYYVYDPDAPNRLLAVIAPDKPLRVKKNATQQPPIFIIEKNRVIIHNTGADSSFDYDFKEQNINLTKENLEKNSWPLMGTIPLGLLLFSCLGLFLARILQSLALSLISLLAFKRKRWHAHLDYSAVLRITIAALTPATVISGIGEVWSLFSALPYQHEFLLTTLFMLIIFYYLHFGFKANRKELAAEPMEHPERAS